MPSFALLLFDNVLTTVTGRATIDGGGEKTAAAKRPPRMGRARNKGTGCLSLLKVMPSLRKIIAPPGFDLKDKKKKLLFLSQG
ncbi:hypothetical protein P8452_13358 [Trifolium repens]|nr:hypothetical protein P8452_13358 [Trifolium repens]